MNDEINYKSNPLHGLSLKNMLVELVDHYGFEILYAYLYINCFKTNPSIASSVKFLKNTDWARENVEGFYLYEFKNLPRASAEQYELSPRDRVIPADQKPGTPAVLSLEDAERLREKRAKKSAGFRPGPGRGAKPQRGRKTEKREDTSVKSEKAKSPRAEKSPGTERSPNTPVSGSVDPWAKWKKET